jgi:sensor histidine kinase YesM
MQNPFLSSSRNFYYYAGVWTFITCFHVILFSFSGRIEIVPAITDALLSNLLFSALGLGIWFPIFFGKADQEKFGSAIINNVAGGIITVSLWLGLSYFLLTTGLTDEYYRSFLLNSLPWRSGIGFLYYEMLILVYYLIIYYRNNKENRLKEAELKALVKESELNSLKSQINPHFLFNSLNSISSLTMISPAKAQEMIIKLSEFLRYTTSHNNERLTTLEHEIGNINRYLDIEKTRFGNRLVVKQSIDEPCFNLKLPGLILQPLLENAIKYGASESTQESLVEISCTCNSAALSVNIRNQWDPDFQLNKGEGVGLRNIRSRLRILYNRDDLFIIKKDAPFSEVKIIFPQQ